MQNPAILVGAVLAACASSFVFVKVLAPQEVEKPPDVGPFAQLADLQEGLVALQENLDRLEARLGSSGQRSALPVTDEQVRRVLADFLKVKGVEVGELAADANQAPEVDVEVMFARLTTPGLSWDKGEQLWKEVRDAGLLDGMVAKFEALAKAQPDLADVHAALGSAYIQKLVTVNDMEKGAWSMKADAAFDEALDLDPQHWEARFSKAVSLSFWPAFLGRGPEAIKNFEILVDQQERSGTVKPHHAETYLFLGNMYEQRGKAEEAREMWQRGYNLHPSNGELKRKVSSGK